MTHRQGLLVAIVVSACSSQSLPPPDDDSDPLAQSVGALAAASEVPAELRMDRGVLSGAIIRVRADGADPVARARGFLARFAPLYGIDDRASVVVARVPAPAEGPVVFREEIDGLPVFGAEVAVHLADDMVFATVGRLVRGDTDVERGARISGADAVGRARAHLGSDAGRLLAPAARAIFDPAIIDARSESAPREVWLVPLEGGLVVVSARDGTVPFVESRRQPLAPQYDLTIHAWEPAGEGSWMGTKAADELGVFPDFIADGQVNDLYAHFTTVWHWYFDAFQRAGYDGDGGEGRVFAHEFSGDPNAWYVFGKLHFFDEYVALDVVGHEFTHGVIRFTSNLLYENESGALNESFADIFGNLIEGENWTCAENAPVGTIRDMRAPSRFDHPDRYSDYMITPWDHGGVHTNSGIPNRAFVLMVEGGSQGGIGVSGIGRAKARALAYDVMTGLPANATLADARDLYVGIAFFWTLAGKNGFALGDVCNVRNAWAAVEVGWTDDTDCDGIKDLSDGDDDDDGVGDALDNCPRAKNPSQRDLDGDGAGDACDDDDDGDGVMDTIDVCPRYADDLDQADSDHDGIGDRCEDADGDEVPDVDDNCLVDVNPDQDDWDHDGLGDACDLDFDNDGALGWDADNCPFKANPDQADADGDGVGDACDPCPSTGDAVTAWATGLPELGIPPTPILPDDDGDGTPNSCDPSPTGNMFLRDAGTGAVLAGLVVGADVSVRVEETGMPDATLTGASHAAWLPIAICDDCIDGFEVGYRAEIRVSGLPSDAVVTVRDAQGDTLANVRRARPDGDAVLRFAPRGAEHYFLWLEATADTPAFGADISVRTATDLPSFPRDDCPDGASEGRCLESDGTVGICESGGCVAGCPSVAGPAPPVLCLADLDGDGFGVTTGAFEGCSCGPGTVEAGEPLVVDCFDDASVDSGASLVHPGQTSYFAAGFCPRARTGGCVDTAPSFDYDCNGVEESRWSAIFSSCVVSSGACEGSGWAGSVPACGQSEIYWSCRFVGRSCESLDEIRAQQCR